MYKKFIPPLLTLTVLSGFILTAPPAVNAASNEPVKTANLISTASAPVVSVPATVKMTFERSMVATVAAPKPVEVKKSSSDDPEKSDANTEQPAGETTTQKATEDITTSGDSDVEKMQLNAQKAYLASADKDPLVIHPDKAIASSDEIVKIAKAKAGVHYVWAGTSPETGWDCSGYVQWVFAQAGIKLPRVSQWVGQEKISFKDALPGDLVVQNHGTHVGIYLGNGKMISALNPSVGTLEHSVDIMPADFYRIVK